jgi:serpin B
MQHFFLTGLAVSTLLGVTAVIQAQPGLKVKENTAAVVGGNNEFALDLYGKLAAEKGNLFFSPYSISSALAMTYAGARTQTAEQMAKTLHFNLEDKLLHPAFADLNNLLVGAGRKRHYQLNIANALWGQKNYGFRPDYLKLTRQYYGAGLNELDFEKATEEARKTINAWVEKQTNNKIKDLIPAGALEADTRLVLTNAIYFKASWVEAFSEKLTKKEDFKVSAGSKVAVPMMHRTDHFSLVDADTFQMLELPYESHDLSLLVFLPKKVDGLADFEKSLTAANLAKWLKQRKLYQVDVALPKFKITAEFKLKPVLSALGMPLAFSKDADFSGMTSQEKLFIDQVLHKAFVDVHEKGTEAAAATAVTMRPTGAPVVPKATFRADHPFTFMIRENHTNSILFAGRLLNP